jgi:hypothetical protein
MVPHPLRWRELGTFTMKYAFAAALFLAGVSAASAQYVNPYSNPYGSGVSGSGSSTQNHQVEGYVRRDGTYVAPHMQTNPNRTQTDNFGTRGNYNPYTGQYGTRTPGY